MRITTKIKRTVCHLLGHVHNENPQFTWCKRCGLCYEDITYLAGYGNYWEEIDAIQTKQVLRY